MDKLKSIFDIINTDNVELVEHAIKMLCDDTTSDFSEHCLRTGKVSEFVALKLTRDEEFSKQVRLASNLHDIGKSVLDIDVLLSNRQLTQAEREMVKGHTDLGKGIIDVASDGIGEDDDRYDIIQTIKDVVLYHHENWDGSGYPDGVSGESIPLPARIVSVADTFDALRTKRSYKDPKSLDFTINFLVSQSGKKFDPTIIDVFVNNQKEIDHIRKERSKNI